MSLTTYLQSKKPIIVRQTFKTLFGAVESRDLVIPPLNTDIRFGDVLPQKTTTTTTSPLVFGRGATETEWRENFSWAVPDEQLDDDDILFKKTLIHPVFDQQGCGSCWAVAFATTMSDCLVVSGAVSWFPYVSTTFCMACYPQSQCRGGQPAQLVLDVQNYGVADVTCIDYSWCENDSACNIRDSSRHFHVEDQSSKIPNCGCYFSNDKYVYKVDPGTETFSIADNNPETIETYRQAVKNHIVNYGPIIGGYLVLKNFLSGSFTQDNGGVYFDRADYDVAAADGSLRFSDNVKSSFNSQGLHAVSIVGWGMAKNIQYDNGRRGDVPYWHCRNSWGKEWGDDGYFKLAMYPFNRTAQFDKTVIVNVKGYNARIGGVILFKATQPPEIRTMKDIQAKYKLKITKSEPNTFYNVDAEDVQQKEENQVRRRRQRREIREISDERPSPQVMLLSTDVAMTITVVVVVVVMVVVVLLFAKKK